MSYILDALKKSQAARQLGELPTIHAPSVPGSSSVGVTLRQPVWLLLGGLMLLVVCILLALLWRSMASPPIAPVVLAPPPVSVLAAVPLTVASAPPVMAAPHSRPEAPAKRPAAPVVPPVPVSAPVSGDDVILSLRDLPEPIQRQIPTLAIGGYIYSNNPLDRLLLIDKVLRHEGDEVAPGLLLEKLLPKAAQFNFKGYRYRLTY